MIYVPDNLDSYNYYEKERERIERIHKKEMETDIDIEDLPFYFKEVKNDNNVDSD